MRAVRIFSAGPLAAILALTVAGPHLGPPDPIPAPLAHSALVTLEGAVAPGALLFRVRANSPGTALNVSNFQVQLDGRPLPVTARADGSWRVPLPAATTGDGKLEVTVTHDGIREVLAAQVALPDAGSSAAAKAGSGIHNQMLWWILNIAIVLIAALAISRRMG
jgi:hypothetical protein